MSAYVIFIRVKTNDAEEINIYAEKAPAGLVGHPITPLTIYGTHVASEALVIC